MVSHVKIEGFDDFIRYTETIEDRNKPVFVLFSGTKGSDGRSWCPDCVLAEPILKQYLSELKRNCTFVYVEVGEREYWKNMTNPFRTDNRTKLMVIPTLIRWGGVQRLEGSQCNNKDLLRMLFEEEDD